MRAPPGGVKRSASRARALRSCPGYGIGLQKRPHLRLQPLRIVPHQEMVAAIAHREENAVERSILAAENRFGRFAGSTRAGIRRPCPEHASGCVYGLELRPQDGGTTLIHRLGGGGAS